MTVKELIDILSQQDPNLEVVLKHIDRRDHQHNVELKDNNIKVEKLDWIGMYSFREKYECLVIELKLMFGLENN